MREIDQLHGDLDPIKDPGPWFDPADPQTAGRLVALALTAQEKRPLAEIKRSRTYGAGVYAIYYEGTFPDYALLAGKETPLYVGKADPRQSQAKSPRDQGPALVSRLADHLRMIETIQRAAQERATSPRITVDEFTCRRLVCATNAQLVAEQHLIRMFRPIWNSGIGVCWGISKHGDDADTRANDRSPWDTMHPGRPWADRSLRDQVPLDEIRANIRQRLEEPGYIFESPDQVVLSFLQAFRQSLPITPEVPTEDLVDAADIPPDDPQPSPLLE